MKAAMMNSSDIGLSRNMRKDPPDIIKDLRKLSSNIGPKTKARIKGVGSYPNFFIKNPTTPKKIITPTSNTVLLRL
jgi:hypothetical protein